MLHTLDVKGEVCPYSTVKTKKKMKDLAIGDQLKVIFDYPLTAEEIPRWAEKAGHKVIEVNKTGDAEWEILLEKAVA